MIYNTLHPEHHHGKNVMKCSVIQYANYKFVVLLYIYIGV